LKKRDRSRSRELYNNLLLLFLFFLFFAVLADMSVACIISSRTPYVSFPCVSFPSILDARLRSTTRVYVISPPGPGTIRVAPFQTRPNRTYYRPTCIPSTAADIAEKYSKAVRLSRLLDKCRIAVR
jgi:hypothetical protein